MVRIWRRRTALALMFLVSAVIVTSHVALRRDTTEARAGASGLRSELTELEDEIVHLADRRAQLRTAQSVASAEHRAAVDRLGAVKLSESEERERLRRRTEEREAVRAELDALRATVTAAAAETERNQALLRALDRCLDGATRAANAMSVGDVVRALDVIGDVRGACEQVDVVVGN